ncbi:MAG: hypothetical protein HQ481_21095 [Alphaproteobacteria bacterium]|nr:hypothetical protein [Alphaproteobacteria bacterium]
MRLSILALTLAMTLAATLTMGLITVTATSVSAAPIDEANAKVEAVINDLGIDRSRIKSIYLAPDLGAGRNRSVQSYTGWVAFNDCRGSLVIDLGVVTQVRTMYTTGDCIVPGVSR